jgi:hypothetical protein
MSQEQATTTILSTYLTGLLTFEGISLAIVTYIIAGYKQAKREDSNSQSLYRRTGLFLVSVLIGSIGITLLLILHLTRFLTWDDNLVSLITSLAISILVISIPAAILIIAWKELK